METALRYLDYRARTVQEVRDKLRDAGYESDETEQCIGRLLELHYLDDTEYALTYLKRGLEKRRGRLRIFRELAERGIGRETAQQAVYRYEDEEEADIGEIEWQNAFSEASGLFAGREITDKVRAKAGRRLSSLGYETSLIYAVLRSAGKDSDYE